MSSSAHRGSLYGGCADPRPHPDVQRFDGDDAPPGIVQMPRLWLPTGCADPGRHHRRLEPIGNRGPGLPSMSLFGANFRRSRPLSARAASASVASTDGGWARRTAWSGGVAGEPDPGEHPAGVRGEEIAVGAPGVPRWGRPAAPAQDLLVDHELAVVLADRPGGGRKAGIGGVGAGGPLPDRSVETLLDRSPARRARGRAPPIRPPAGASPPPSGRRRQPRTS